jgi:hypothetical protein
MFGVNQFGEGFFVNSDTDDYGGMVVVASSNSVVTRVTNVIREYAVVI